MFVLDTNVLSAMMGSRALPELAAWVVSHAGARFFTTSVCQADIFAGVAILPEGRRRSLEAASQAIFADDFEGRILPFDEKAAKFYAEIFAARKRAGKPTATMDLMIAAIARAHGATMVTRNTADFEGCGITLVNPWEAP
jgi:predicted nucleic acid-binding protein